MNKDAVRYSLMYSSRMILAFALVLSMVVVLLGQFYDAVPDAGGPPTIDLVKASIGSLVPFIPIPLMAYYAGCQCPNSRKRLVSRIVLNAYLVVSIVMFSDSLSYSIQDLTVSEGLSITTDRITMSLDVTMLTLPLYTIPACSVLDAILESRKAE